MSQPRFKFTGTINFPKAESKRPFLKTFTKDGIEMASMTFGVQESKNNIGFVECFGSVPKNKKIKSYDSDGNQIEIEWDDRFNEDSIKAVASFRKNIVNLGEDFGGRKEFISQYDAILYLKENLPNYKGKICVTGQMQKQWYEDKFYDKFQIQNVYAVDDEHKNRLSITADIYYNKESVDMSDWKEEKKIYINGYIQQYINKDEGTKYVPQTFVFNGSKYDENNEKHKKLLDYKMKYVKCDKKKYHHLLWECVVLNGNEEVDFDESQLTAAQKEQLELGIRTLEDFRPNGSIYGERVTEYRLFEPSLIKSGNDDFTEGFIDCDMKDSEFEEEIYVPAKKEKLSDVIDEAEKKKKEESNKETETNDDGSVDVEIDDDEIDTDDLF